MCVCVCPLLDERQRATRHKKLDTILQTDDTKMYCRYMLSLFLTFLDGYPVWYPGEQKIESKIRLEDSFSSAPTFSESSGPRQFR